MPAQPPARIARGSGTVGGSCHGWRVDSANDQFSVSPETSLRRYVFSTTPGLAELGTSHYRLADADVVKSFLDCMPRQHTGGPASLAIFRDPDLVEAYRWGMRDSARLGVFASWQAVEHFEACYPGYRRPRAALDAASFALGRMDSAATAAANQAGRELTRIAFRTARQGVSKDQLQGVWAAANMARAVAWDYHGGRSQIYLREAVAIAAAVDQHLNDRVKLWLAFYLHARNALPGTPECL